MKALVCPQCGGLINEITDTHAIAECEYCGAKIFVEKAEKTKELPGKRDTLHIPLADYKPFDEPEAAADEPAQFTDQQTKSVLSTLIGIFGVLTIMVTMVALVYVAAKKPGRGNPAPSPTPYVYVRGTPAPPRDVRSYTNKDALSLPQPIIPPNMFFKTEFDVEAYVSIDEQGNVFEASTNQAQIPQIDRIVIAAAKKAKFPPSPTNQKTSGILNYVLGPKTK